MSIHIVKITIPALSNKSPVSRLFCLNSYFCSFVLSTVCRSFSDRITLLTGETSLESINSVFSLANAHLTTFVTTSHSKEEAGVLRNDLRDDYFVSMRPSLTKALVDLLKHFQWSKFAYIYQDMNGKYYN